MQIDLPLIVVGGIEGYEMNALDAWMADHGHARRWEGWMDGQTMAIADGQVVVYRWDVERFLDGRPIID